MNVYILRSEKNGRLYIGVTQDVNLRLEQHNKGENRSTKTYCPWKLVRVEKYKDKLLALKRERFLKTGKGRIAVRNFLKG